MNNIFANLSNLVKSGYKTNAFAPLVWFTAVSLPILLYFGFKTSNTLIQFFLIGASVFIVLFAAIMYLVIFLKDPKLLQSEGYRLEDKKLDLIAEKGGAISINPVNINPKELSDPTLKIES